MTTRFNFGGEHLILVQCGNCGVKHAIPVFKYDSAVEEGGFWHCPNGHERGFREGKREKEAIQRERDRLKQENARLQDEIAAVERSKERVKAEMKRHKKRAAAGLCPCCNRTFSNMTRHMKTEHPDYNVVPLNAKT